ncbi:hypothetical protein DFH07DRAFT_952052 [Mycena maculata]|uniref:Uncharacterized protein n=1 Tax=Mycena maculata TaxID=230809 RepID=A0AAD7K2F2_9AGAR|nr:hypothetical protein DFH07DRAFT_952052 [Mycena maculata]
MAGGSLWADDISSCQTVVPKSLVQPWPITELKEFMVDELPSDYPYAVRKTSAVFHIPYFEFHGMGAPLNLDVGSGGDVYVDMTPGAYTLWGYTAEGWKRWVDMGEDVPQTLSNRWAVIHPGFKHILWISGGHTHRISWLKHGKASIHDTRRFAVQRRLMKIPSVGSKKDEETAHHEAAAILASLEDLKSTAKFTDLFSPVNIAGRTLGDPSGPVVSTGHQARDDVEIPNHPCFINPDPVSQARPHLTTKLKAFLVTTLPP